jgi:DNA-directed RNA polymerase specialized sigma24 family protein
VPEPPLPDEELAELAAAGDRRAFARLHERHAPGLRDFAARVVGDPRLATRVVATAAAEARAALRDGRARGAPKAWLYAAAYRAALDALPDRLRARAAGPALLDLHLRYRLEVDELAPSLGVPRRALADRLGRVRERHDDLVETFVVPAPVEPAGHRLRWRRPAARTPLLAAGVALLVAATTGAVLAARGGGVDDPADLRAVNHRVGEPGSNVVKVAWSRLEGARGYSVVWSRDADRLPDQRADLPGSATGARSPVLAQGTWWFALRTLGREDEWSEGLRLGPFVVPPPAEARIEKRPAAASNTRSATFAFSASETGAELECALDGAAFRACESPRAYRRLKPGRHRFAVRATGVSLAVGEPVVYAWTIDVRTPRTRLTTKPPAATPATTARFRFAAGEHGVRFECKLDGSRWRACKSPTSFRHLAEERHRFLVRARDRAGNADRSPALFSWVVDRTPPDTSIDGPSGRTGASARFELGATEAGAGFRCSLDGAAFTGCSSPLTLTGVGNGYHMLRVASRDAAGNTDETPAEWSWRVDARAPGTLLTGHPPSVTRSRRATFTFLATEERVTFECSLDEREFTPCSSPVTYISLEPGRHVFLVRARDRVGNVDQTPVSWRWRVR